MSGDGTRLRLVRIAEFTYRHEAEFAAGFLRDAGLPFQIQVDDAMMGMGSTTATLWVRDQDEKDAREVLGSAGLDPSEVRELEEMAESLAIEDGSIDDDYADASMLFGAKSRSTFDAVQPPETGSLAPVRRGEVRVGPVDDGGSLRGQERIVSTLFGVGIGGSSFLLPIAFPGAVSIALLVVGALFISAGLAGKAPEALRSFLQAIAGGAP